MGNRNDKSVLWLLLLLLWTLLTPLLDTPLLLVDNNPVEAMVMGENDLGVAGDAARLGPWLEWLLLRRSGVGSTTRWFV